MQRAGIGAGNHGWTRMHGRRRRMNPQITQITQMGFGETRNWRDQIVQNSETRVQNAE